MHDLVRASSRRCDLGQEPRRVGLELLEEDAVAGDLRLDLAVGRAGDADADRAARRRGAAGGSPARRGRSTCRRTGRRCRALGRVAAPAPPSSRSRKARPWLVAARSAGRRGSGQLASLTVLSVSSAEVPPITIARWYGGQAAVPSVRIFSSRNCSSDVGFSSALVSWKRKVLLAEPPPLVTNRNSYSSPSARRRCSIWAGRLVPVFFSSYIVSGASLRVAQVGARVGVVDARATAPPRRRRR